MSYNPAFGMPPDQTMNQFPGAQPPQPIAPQGPTMPMGAMAGGQPGQGMGNPTGFDPAQAQALLALHGQQNQQATVARQRKLADQLRADAGGQMQGKQVGRVYVGPKWYDALASVGADAAASYGDVKAKEGADKLDTDYEKTMADFINSYKNKRSSIMSR